MSVKFSTHKINVRQTNKRFPNKYSNTVITVTTSYINDIFALL